MVTSAKLITLLTFIGSWLAGVEPEIPAVAAPSAQVKDVPAATDRPDSDGWCGAHTTFQLEQTSAPAALVVRGQIPAIGSPPLPMTMVIRIDGVALSTTSLTPGDFEVRSLVLGAIGLKRVELGFDHTNTLPAPDGRTVAALLKLVGFERITCSPEAWRLNDGHRTDVVGAGDGVGLGPNWYPFESWQGQYFRWVGKAAELAIASSQAGILTIEAEAGPGLGGKPGKLRLVDHDGTVLDVARLGRRTASDLSVSAAAIQHQPLHLEVEGGGSLVPGDSRILDARVFTLTFHALP